MKYTKVEFLMEKIYAKPYDNISLFHTVVDDMVNQVFMDLEIAEGFQNPNFAKNPRFGEPDKDNESQAHGILLIFVLGFARSINILNWFVLLVLVCEKGLFMFLPGLLCWELVAENLCN
jgi:hypothetical protein